MFIIIYTQFHPDMLLYSTVGHCSKIMVFRNLESHVTGTLARKTKRNVVWPQSVKQQWGIYVLDNNMSA